MRRVKRAVTAGTADERGVIAPMVAFLMVAMMGMAALVIDTGMMYSEHAQLQNGADASALAIARVCAVDPASVDCQKEKDTASVLASANALDGATEVVHAEVKDQTARVEVQSLDTTGKKRFSLVFARALGIADVDIRAAATAKWSSPSSARTFPLALSRDCWELGPTTLSTMKPQRITWKPGTTCTDSSGKTVPGGWGWLEDTTEGVCQVTTKAGDWVTSHPGNSPPKACKDILKGWVDTLTAGGKVHVLFPIFSTATGQGNTGTFHIVGYATFELFAWNFGDAKGPYKFRADATTSPMTSNLACNGIDDRCLIGAFVKYQTSGGGSGGQDFGTSSVSLIK